MDRYSETLSTGNKELSKRKIKSGYEEKNSRDRDND